MFGGTGIYPGATMFGGTTLFEKDQFEPSTPAPNPTSSAEEATEPTEPDVGEFYAFENQVIELDKYLRQLSNAARQLGSSVGILSASFRLCERLARILFLFRQNASALFPQKVRLRTPELNVDRYWNFKRQRRIRRSGNRFLSLVTRMSSSHEQPKAKDLPFELHLFAKDLATLLDCLSQFPDFVEEVPEQTLEMDLKIWASRLKTFEDDIETPAVRRYIHDLSANIGGRLQRIREFIPIFTKVGVPTIRNAQKHSAANLINLSTIAALFSGVTATMIQFSYTSTDSVKANAVNSFWFTSLIFSISAAVNSLLGLTWMQAIFRSPDHRVPWWVMIWIKRSPLAFMVLSVACFFIGLILFVYSSGQNVVTCIVTAVLSTACCFGLTALSLWFAFERWIFDWHQGHKWLSDVLSEAGQDVLDVRAVAWGTIQMKRGFSLSHKFFALLGRVTGSLSRTIGTRSSASSSTAYDDPEALDALELGIASSVAVPRLSADVTTAEREPEVPGNGRTLAGRERFISVVQRIIIAQRISREPHRPSPKPIPRSSKRQITESSDVVGTVSSATINALMPKLMNLRVTAQLDAHRAMVRDIQFSPDGMSLATSSWDKESLILDVEDNYHLHVQRTLHHPSGYVSQVEWSPDGSMLMTKLNKVIKLWSKEGQIQRSIVRKRPVQSIRWLPNSQGFLSVEDDGAVRMDLEGQVRIRYTVDGMEMSDVVVTNDQTWMICVGNCPSESNSLDNRSGTSQIILYNLRTCTIAKRAPVFYDVSDVILASDNQSALVSFNDKVPSQLWKIQLSHDPTIVFRQTYVLDRGEFSPLASIFGGENDHLVLRAGKSGDIHIWDRESANLLHRVRAPVGSIDHLSSLAWNAARGDEFMFAAGSHDGAIRIWTTSTLGQGSLHRDQDPASPRTPYTEYTSSPKLLSRRLPSSSGSFGIGYRSESPPHMGTEGGGLSRRTTGDNANDEHVAAPRARRALTFS